ncbi:hypothetical protein DFP72DRAFT_845316 [Ephemerocybe angulata]|uniref:Uncharacterized protein n=1 Tax=Ephemerocybe angulata TaxID=980116 RepID=A0A8H6MAV8_9AGAR|nr:hypothetical protein DFP72DRAFT_845316 [Tulosesus angulatus]
MANPRFPDEEKLPFWAISSWQQLLEIRDARSMWKKSSAWCRTETDSAGLALPAVACESYLKVEYASQRKDTPTPRAQAGDSKRMHAASLKRSSSRLHARVHKHTKLAPPTLIAPVEKEKDGLGVRRGFLGDRVFNGFKVSPHIIDSRYKVGALQVGVTIFPSNFPFFESPIVAMFKGKRAAYLPSTFGDPSRQGQFQPAEMPTAGTLDSVFVLPDGPALQRSFLNLPSAGRSHFDAYVVFSGRLMGVVPSWNVAHWLTNKYPTASLEGYPSLQSAKIAWDEAVVKGQWGSPHRHDTEGLKIGIPFEGGFIVGDQEDQKARSYRANSMRLSDFLHTYPDRIRPWPQSVPSPDRRTSSHPRTLPAQASVHASVVTPLRANPSIGSQNSPSVSFSLRHYQEAGSYKLTTCRDLHTDQQQKGSARRARNAPNAPTSRVDSPTTSPNRMDRSPPRVLVGAVQPTAPRTSQHGNWEGWALPERMPLPIPRSPSPSPNGCRSLTPEDVWWVVVKGDCPGVYYGRGNAEYHAGAYPEALLEVAENERAAYHFFAKGRRNYSNVSSRFSSLSSAALNPGIRKPSSPIVNWWISLAPTGKGGGRRKGASGPDPIIGGPLASHIRACNEKHKTAQYSSIQWVGQEKQEANTSPCKPHRPWEDPDPSEPVSKAVVKLPPVNPEFDRQTNTGIGTDIAMAKGRSNKSKVSSHPYVRKDRRSEDRDREQLWGRQVAGSSRSSRSEPWHPFATSADLDFCKLVTRTSLSRSEDKITLLDYEQLRKACDGMSEMGIASNACLCNHYLPSFISTQAFLRRQEWCGRSIWHLLKRSPAGMDSSSSAGTRLFYLVVGAATCGVEQLWTAQSRKDGPSSKRNHVPFVHRMPGTVRSTSWIGDQKGRIVAFTVANEVKARQDRGAALLTSTCRTSYPRFACYEYTIHLFYGPPSSSRLLSSTFAKVVNNAVETGKSRGWS